MLSLEGEREFDVDDGEGKKLEVELEVEVDVELEVWIVSSLVQKEHFSRAFIGDAGVKLLQASNL